MKTLTDLSLIAQAAIGHNRRAFDTLVRKYSHRSDGSSCTKRWATNFSAMTWHRRLSSVHGSDWGRFADCRTSPPGCYALHTTCIMTIFATGRRRQGWTHCLRVAKECANSLRWMHMSTSIRHSPSCALTSGRA